MERAYSPSEILKKKIPSIPFEGVWRDAFGEPGRTGVWLIWGESANGKSSFAMQLARELTKPTTRWKSPSPSPSKTICADAEWRKLGDAS